MELTQSSIETDAARATENRLDPTPFLGTWMNTNSASTGIVRVVMARKDGVFTMQVLGACEPAPCDWGEAVVEQFAESGGAHGGGAFSSFYDFGFMDSYLHGWIKLGVLVVVKFDRFKDESGRSNRFSREFFYRLEP